MKNNEREGGRLTACGRVLSGPGIQPGMSALLVVGALFFTACSSTHIKSARDAAGFSAGPFRNMLVVGNDERQDVRSQFENDLVRYLQKHNVHGSSSSSSSHGKFGLNDFKEDRDGIRQRLAGEKAESVLFVSLTDRVDSLKRAPEDMPLNGWDAANTFRYTRLTAAGGSINTYLRLKVQLYRVSDGALVWSAQVNTVMKEDDDSIVALQKLAKAIVARMAGDKVIPPSP